MSTTALSDRPRIARRRRFMGAALAAGAVALLTVVPATTSDAAASKVTICHQTGNLRYVIETVDVNSVVGGGHGHHAGDIIPAFNARQGNRDLHYGGSNLGVVRTSDGLTGAQVLAAGCATPPVATTAQLVPPTSGTVAVPTPVDTLAPTPTTEAVPTPTGSAAPTTGVPTTVAPDTTGPPPTPTATPAPRPTLAPTPTNAPTPTPASTNAPTPTPASTNAPTPTPAPTNAPTPTPASTNAPTPTPASTLAPTPTTGPNCPDGEISHAGECFAVPPLVITPTPSLPTITSQPESASLAPVVQCVDDRSDGVSVVWFGYESTTESAVIVERGPANQVTPRGTPPTLFGPGLHIFVLAVETTDGVASWTLAGNAATSNDESPDCATALTTETSEPGTTEPGTSAPGTTAGTTPSSTTPGSTTPGTTTPGATTPGSATTDACAPGQAESDGACSPVEPVRLVLVDNVLECDGHGVARFAAFNDNVFALDADNATSVVSPLRLAEAAPVVIDERDVVSDDDRETAALFTVRYVTSVTWTVSHHGLEASISAGIRAADTNPDCPDAIVNSAGAHGLLGTPGPLATTGSDDAAPLALVATLVSALGIGLVMAARRRDSHDARLDTTA